jgi:hypothetical protein
MRKVQKRNQFVLAGGALLVLVTAGLLLIGRWDREAPTRQGGGPSRPEATPSPAVTPRSTEQPVGSSGKPVVREPELKELSDNGLDALIRKSTDDISEGRWRAPEPFIAQRVMLGGMTRANQPEGYTNYLEREEKGGRYVAFLSSRDGKNYILVHDRATGKVSIVPPPPCKDLYDPRCIVDFLWSSTEGDLYVLESVVRKLETEGRADTQPPAAASQGSKEKCYAVLYLYRVPQDAVVHMAPLESVVWGFSVGNDSVCVGIPAGEDSEEIRVHQFDKSLVGNTQYTARMVLDGENLRYTAVQLLAGNGELWFLCSQLEKERAAAEKKRSDGGMWLAVTNFRENAKPKLVFPHVRRYMWNPEGTIIAFYTTEDFSRKETLYVASHGTLSSPRALHTQRRVGLPVALPQIAGFSASGSDLILEGLNVETLTEENLRDDGVRGLFHLPIGPP